MVNIRTVTARQKAQANGLSKYIGKPCKYGHSGERYVINTNCCACCAEYHQKNREVILAKKREYTINNKEKMVRLWKEKRIRRKAKMTIYMRERRKNNIQERIKHNLRTRIRHSILEGHKSGSTVRDLGCSIEEFKHYIEQQFRDGMTWASWGSLWSLDHIEPLCSFDLTNREQFLKAAHYLNYQPLLNEEHKAKTKEDVKKKRKFTDDGRDRQQNRAA